MGRSQKGQFFCIVGKHDNTRNWDVRNRNGASVSLESTIQQAPSLFLLYWKHDTEKPSLFLLYWKHDTASPVPIATMLEARYRKNRSNCSKYLQSLTFPQVLSSAQILLWTWLLLLSYAIFPIY